MTDQDPVIATAEGIVDHASRRESVLPVVYVPYTELLQVTKEAVEKYGPYYCKMNTDSSYPELLNALWSVGFPFINVEHDVVPHEGAIEELWECPHAWCTFMYEGDDNPIPTIGCTKFGPYLFQLLPDVWHRMLQGTKYSEQGLPHWAYCDLWLFQEADAIGFGCHIHEGRVPNL